MLPACLPVCLSDAGFFISNTRSCTPPPKACLLYAGGELHVIEYGVDEVVLRCTQRLLQPYMHS